MDLQTVEEMRYAILLLLFIPVMSNAASVDISCVLRADKPEYFNTGVCFGGSAIGLDCHFDYSAFNEPGNDKLAIESPVVELKAIGVDIDSNITITNVTLELLISQPFWLGSTPIECSGRIKL